MKYEYEDRRLGMIFGFYALIGLLFSGTIIIALGHVAVGATVLGAGVISTVIGTFVHGRRRIAVMAAEEEGDDDEDDEDDEGDKGDEDEGDQKPPPKRGFLEIVRSFFNR